MNIFQEMLNKAAEEEKSGSRDMRDDEKREEKQIEKPADNAPVKDEQDRLDFFDPDAKDPTTGILLRHLDPRPDKKEDHEDWVDMLQNCLVWGGFKEGNGEQLWGVLHGLRCGGARIQRVRGSALGYKLLQGEWKDEDWQRVRKDYLDAVKDDLVSLFKFTKEHGKIPRMEEIWPETGEKSGNNDSAKPGQKAGEQTKIF